MAATMELGSDADPRNATFSISDEDHTLGNSLRFVLNKE
jgi:DNA-directed RNA polymerase subunit L